MHALSVSLLRAKQLPVITNGLGASPHAGSTCTIGVVTVRPLNRLPARLYFKLKPDPNNTFFFIFTCTTQYPWVLANLNLSQAMAPSKKKRIHTVFRDSSAHRSASTSKPRFVGEKVPFADAFTEVSRGTKKFKQSEYAEIGAHPIVDQGKEAIAGYSDEENGLFTDVPAIVFGDHTRCVKYVEEPFFAGADGVKILKPKLPGSTRFWWHALRATPIEDLGYSRHFKLLKAAKFKVINETRQEEVVACLDGVLEQISYAEDQLTGFDSLVKSRFVEMFGELDTNPKGFQLTCFDDLGTWTSGGTPSRKNPSYFTGEIDWYSAGELNSLHLGRSKERISLRAIEESSAKLVPPGSLFVGMYDTAALKMGITTKESSSNQACANLVPNGIVDLVWLYFAIDQLKPSLLAKRSGCRQKNLSLKKIKSFMVPLPDLDSQQGFSRFVAQVDKSRFVRDHEMNFR